MSSPVPATPLDTLRALFGPNLEELAGGACSGEIPLTATLINRLIADKLATSHAPVTQAVIELHDHDAIIANITLRGPRFLPNIKVSARIEQQPELPESPVLWLRWSLPNLGPLGLFASPFVSRFTALPPGIRLDGDRLAIDVRGLLESRGFGDVLQHVRRLSIYTRAGAIVVGFEVRVASTAARSRST